MIDFQLYCDSICTRQKRIINILVLVKFEKNINILIFNLMKQKQNLLFIVLSLLLLSGGLTSCSSGDDLIYKNPEESVERRVDDLLKRMTIEEKVGQMSQYVGLQHMRASRVEISEEDLHKSHSMGFYADCPPEKIEEMTREGIIGSFLHVLSAEEANHLQALAMESRLQIPLIIGIDAMHGNAQVVGATVYPTEIGQASSFNPVLVERLNRETALEMRATGSQWTFAPNVEVSRDARWGRTGDTFGEDTYLVSTLGVAAVKGFQGDGTTPTESVIACAKHLVGGGQSVNGINGAPLDVSERTLKEVFLPPFKACVDAGVRTIMPAHNEYNGIPCHGNRALMNDMLRDEWGFEGFLVSDWMDVERMYDYHSVVGSREEAYALTLDAGLDVNMHGPDFYYRVLEMVADGKISEKRIEQSVRKILESKFELGLFENPFVDEATAGEVLFNDAHKETALELARQGVVLLKNEDILPLNANRYKRVLVTGPNANNQSILGDWAMVQPEENVVTVYEGLKMVSPQTHFTLQPMDWNIREMQQSQVVEASRLASQHDLAVVVVGENSMRYHWTEKTCGENSDRYDLNLYGLQQELVEAIHKTGTPVIVVLVNGRPLTTEWIADNVEALIEAWEPGSFGGQAVAEIIYGDVNPSAKLPITIPRHVGQIQTYYNYKLTSKWFDYATGDSSPLYEFGYGLSYTTYEYGKPTLSEREIGKNGTLNVSFDIVNTGKVAGTEIVQLYIRDECSSVTRPLKELKDYKRVSLKPNETKRVEFTITPDKLAFYNIDMDYVVEPGLFTVMVGSSSRDEDLQRVQFSVK